LTGKLVTMPHDLYDAAKNIIIYDVRAAIQNSLVSFGQLRPPIGPLVLKVKSGWGIGSSMLRVSYGGNPTFILAFVDGEGASKHAHYITELGARTVVSVKLALPAEPDGARSKRRLAEYSSIWIWTMVDGAVKPVQKEALSTGGEIKLWLSDLITEPLPDEFTRPLDRYARPIRFLFFLLFL